MKLSGGCQCGAVRYHIDGELDYPHLCHCRMCQKASGNYFMPLAFAAGDIFKITRGEVSWFQSSDPVRRGFCNQCGTPLLFDTLQSNGVAITLGSLDDPNAVVPISNDGIEAKVHFFETLGSLAGKAVSRDDLPGGLDDVTSTNHQHPDFDT